MAYVQQKAHGTELEGAANLALLELQLLESI